MHGANRLGGNSLTELLVFGRIVGEAAAGYVDGIEYLHRSRDAVDEARRELDDLLAGEGTENARALQRAVRDLMTEYAGVVRDEPGLTEGLHKLDAIEDRLGGLAVHPNIAGFEDLTHAMDLKGSLLAARATLVCARERRETRGAHNRSDYPATDPALKVNLVWSPDGAVTKELVPEAPDEVRRLMVDHDVEISATLVE